MINYIGHYRYGPGATHLGSAQDIHVFERTDYGYHVRWSYGNLYRSEVDHRSSSEVTRYIHERIWDALVPEALRLPEGL